MKQKIIYFALITCAAIGFISCKDASTNPDDLSLLTFDSVRVALYIDNAVWPNCKLYTDNKLKEIGLPYTIINRDTIINGGLLTYSVLLVPGGRPDIYERNLGQIGSYIIRDYVSRGGGYIGICGGAFLAAQTNVWRGWSGEPRTYYSYTGLLRIFNGTADGPIEDFAPTYYNSNCGIEIVTNEHPVTKTLTDTLYYLYDHGPMFITEKDPNAIILGKSLQGDRIMNLVTQYENGRVFLTSGHPEVMNSGPCTDLIRNAILWCSKQNM